MYASSRHVTYHPLPTSISFIFLQLGGTIGDIESAPFVEAMRQFQFRVGYSNFACIHVSLVPDLHGEQKTRPTQTTVHALRGLGLLPDIVRCIHLFKPSPSCSQCDRLLVVCSSLSRLNRQRKRRSPCFAMFRQNKSLVSMTLFPYTTCRSSSSLRGWFNIYKSDWILPALTLSPRCLKKESLWRRNGGRLPRASPYC
jgi:hypothetical protein